MNRLELLYEINEYFPEGQSKIQKKLTQRDFIENPKKYSKIFEEWKKPENKIRGEQWHHFIRLAINFDQIQVMFSRIRYLLHRYRNSTDDYFKANFMSGQCLLPDRISMLDSLLSLFNDYFQIYHSIEEQISFEQIPDVSTNGTIRGKVDWNSTLHKTATPFPLEFDTIYLKKKFDTPENILLILSSIWLAKESHKLLQNEFHDPLYTKETKILLKIVDNSKKILTHFPFYSVVDIVIKNYNVQQNSNVTLKLVSDANMRIKDGLIHNNAYKQLLLWIEKFRTFNFPKLVKNEITSNFLLEATKNIDTLYEIWIFFEIINYFNKKYPIRLHLGEETQYFEFEFQNQLIQFFYEKTFERDGEHAWAHTHTPDFTIVCNNEMIGVFDAKNWNYKPSEEENPINKILAYMANLNCKYGAILWPKREEEILQYNDANNRFSKTQSKISVLSLNPYDMDFNSDNMERVLELLFKNIIANIPVQTFSKKH